MRRVMAIALSLFLLAGCAGAGPLKVICDPTEEQKIAAQQLLALIDSAQNLLALYYPQLTIVKASTALRAIIAGGCFLLQDLRTALDMADRVTRGRGDEFEPLRRLVR